MKKQPPPFDIFDPGGDTGGAGWAEVTNPIIPYHPRRSWVAFAETKLWLATVEDAMATATRLGRGKPLPGATLRVNGWRHNDQREVQNLIDWLVLCPECPVFIGSLPWIAAVVSAATGEEVEVHSVRAFVLSELSFGAGAEFAARKRLSRRPQIVAR